MEITPTTNKIGNAREISPPTTRPIKINGRNTTVTRIFVIPHVAFTPKINNSFRTGFTEGTSVAIRTALTGFASLKSSQPRIPTRHWTVTNSTLLNCCSI